MLQGDTGEREGRQRILPRHRDERQKLDPAKLEREVLDFVAKGVS